MQTVCETMTSMRVKGVAMAGEGGVRVQQAAATRAALVAAAKRLFAEKGYHATGTPELVAAAGVTRGALYHHFADKEALFEAVFRDAENDVVEAASNAVRELAADPWRQLHEGFEAFLRVVADDRGLQRILLLDGPAVLGWLRWREIGSEFTLGLLTDSLRRLTEAGIIRQQPLTPVAHLILAAQNEASLHIAHSSDPEATRAEVTQALMTLISGLR
jgi:AcrR family transcriptional regulator